MADRPPRPEPDPRGHRRAAFFALGWLCFVLGVLGVMLPVVPTTPFMLVALWAFARSSPRFHDWLYHHRLFGPPLQRWQRERSIPAWVKVVALASMAVSMTYVSLVVRPPWYGLLAMGIVIAASVVFFLRIPTTGRQQQGSR